MAETRPGSHFPDLWKAFADIVSEWEPGITPGPPDARLMVALADLSDYLTAYVAARLAGSDDPVRAALAREVIGARMQLMELAHAVNDAMRPRWPADDICGDA